MGRGSGAAVAMLFALAATTLASCGDQKDAGATPEVGVGERVHGTKLADVEIPEGKSRIRTILGEVLEDRDDAVGEWARQKSKQRAQKRKTQRWLQPIDYDFGEQRVGKKLKAELTLQNPRETVQRITGFSKSCTCQQVFVIQDGKRIDVTKGMKAPIELQPGAKAVLEAHVEVPNRQSRLTVAVRLETSDPDFPVLDAQLTVDAVRDLIVHVGKDRRDVIDLQELTKGSERDFEFRIRSRDGKAFEIRNTASAVPPGMKLRFERASETGEEWFVRGKVGPDLIDGSVGGTVKFATDRGSFDATVYWRVEPPIEIKPGTMIAFGVISRLKGASKTLALRCVDKKMRFGIRKVEFFDVPDGLVAGGEPFSSRVEAAEDGRTAKLHIEAPKGLRRGRFHIGAVIHFDGDSYEARKIRLIGHVR